MSVLNVSNCAAPGNTGLLPCAFNPSIFKWFWAIPKGEVIPATALVSNATLDAYIKGKMIEDSPGKRWHMSGWLSQLADNTAARATENKDNALITTQFPPYNFTWDVTWQFAQFAKWRNGFNQKQAFWDFIFCDDMGNIIGTQKTDADDAIGIGGVSLIEFVIDYFKLATTSQVAKFNLTMQFQDNDQINSKMAMVQAGLNASNYQALVSDVIISASTRTSTTTHIYVKMDYDGIGAVSSVGSTWGDVLADADCFVLTVDGSTVVPSAVAYNATYNDYDLTVATMSSSDVVVLKLAPLSTIAVAPFNAPLVSNTYTYTVS